MRGEAQNKGQQDETCDTANNRKMPGLQQWNLRAGKEDWEVYTSLVLSQAHLPHCIPDRCWANTNSGSTVPRHRCPRSSPALAPALTVLLSLRLPTTLPTVPWTDSAASHPVLLLNGKALLPPFSSLLLVFSISLSSKSQIPVNLTSLISSWIPPFLPTSTTATWMGATANIHLKDCSCLPSSTHSSCLLPLLSLQQVWFQKIASSYTPTWNFYCP